jgi:hypothetical protein
MSGCPRSGRELDLEVRRPLAQSGGSVETASISGDESLYMFNLLHVPVTTESYVLLRVGLLLRIGGSVAADQGV